MNKFLKTTANIISVLILTIITLCFLYVLFDTASFIGSVKETVNSSCQTLIEMFKDSNNNRLSIEELKAAYAYIAESNEYFSTVSNNSIISIIYSFATTIILSAGTFALKKIVEKSDDAEGKLNTLKSKSNELNEKFENIENKIKSLNKSCEELLELQNVTSYILYTLILIRDCESNLESGEDNFKLLNDITTQLTTIPNRYRKLKINELESCFINRNCSKIEKAQYLSFTELKNKYTGLIKHYIDFYKENNMVQAKDVPEAFETINCIIEDIYRRQNSNFFKIKQN